MKRLLFVNLLIFGILGNIWATTYYISPTGNDASPAGTITAPWKTLAKATATATQRGDVIQILAGNYTETQRSYLKVGVSIIGAGATTTIIKSTLTGDYGELINLQTPDNTQGNQEITGITFDGSYVSTTNYKTWLAIWITGVSNVSIHDCVIRNFFWRGVIFNGINADNPGTDVGYTKATGNTFYNNVVTNCADYGPASGGGSGALNIGFQKGMLIYNNTLQQNERPEGKNGWPIKYWNQGWIENCKIYNNTIIKKPYGGNYPGESGWDFAIEFFNIMALEIYGNNIQNGAIDLNYNYKGPYAYSTWIHDNTIHNPVLNTKGEGAIILEFRTESALIENNIINNKTYGVSFNTRTPNNKGGDRNNFVGGNVPGGYSYLVDNIVRNNLFTNMYQGSGTVNRFAVGVISEGTANDPQISNMQIYNNTAVAKPGNTSHIGFDFTSQNNGSVAGVTIKDNIIVGFAYESVKGVKAKTQGAVNITNNCYWNNGVPLWPSATITGNFSTDPNLNANYISSLPIGYKPSGIVTPPTCTGWVFGPWSACGSNGLQTRVLLSSLPAGCVGTVPADSLVRSCTFVPPTCVYTYSAPGPCINGVQTVTVVSVSPANCVGTPILTQPCTVIPPPVNDTTRCIVILHGDNLSRRATTYFVKRANGRYYDDRGREVKVWAYETPLLDWFRKDLSDGLFYLWF